MTDDRHARTLRGRDAIAAVLETRLGLTTRLGLDAETARERANNIATALGGCVPGDEIADAVATMLDAVSPVAGNGNARATTVLHVLAAWVETERAS